MPAHKEQEPPAGRSTAQLWSRREKIEHKIAELTAEHVEITRQLTEALRASPTT